jgi:hypothetical protein
MCDMKAVIFCVMLNVSVFGMFSGAKLWKLKVSQEDDRTAQFLFVYRRGEAKIKAGCTVFYDPGASTAPLPDASGLINIQENYFEFQGAKDLLGCFGRSFTSVEFVDDDYVDVGE